MKSLFVILFFLIQLIVFGNEPNFEFSGMDKFWTIVNKLEQNNSPTNKEWNELFETPGYKVLTSNEFSKDFFINKFSLVFMPMKKKELKNALMGKKDLPFLSHYIKVKNNKNKIKEQQRKLAHFKTSKNAINRTKEYLPKKITSSLPPVSFLIFASNGRGSSPIVVDLAATLEWDFESFLAHEYHHWYRNTIIKYTTENISNNNIQLINALSLLEAEGIADMVDKRNWFEQSSNKTSKYARQFINDVGKSPYVIKKIDNVISKSLNKNTVRGLGSSIINLLPQHGHTTGYFMARLIIKELGKKELIKCVGDPIKFIITYNKSARISKFKYPAFSKTTINYLKNITK